MKQARKGVGPSLETAAVSRSGMEAAAASRSSLEAAAASSGWDGMERAHVGPFFWLSNLAVAADSFSSLEPAATSLHFYL